ncbi:MAG: ABC transporter ATP-binding protein/permease [Clostridia bacterium]|nr:ABC transporter ATP-binding protein/permease [Clostridia bacterium]
MLQLSNITKKYEIGDKKNPQQIVALNGINTSFRKSEFVSILGPSGCGKTTLLNIIGGLDKYSEGDLSINGISTVNFTDKDWDGYRNNSVGFVFQNYNLIPHQTVLENVELSLTLAGLGHRERVDRAKNALAKVGLADQMRKHPNQLSGGQMQRVAIARALVNEPDIILADEPTGALDSVTSAQVLDTLKEISKEKLVIMVTHNAELAQQYSTRIITLLDGKITGDSAPYQPPEDLPNELPKSKVKMKTSTCFKLSLRNLLSKRTRTFMISLAGSIGIIGIALVLAVSNGFNLYIIRLQDESMGSFPITLYTSINKTSATDMREVNNQIMKENEDKESYQDIYQTGIKSQSSALEDVGSTVSQGTHTNIFSQQYLDYLSQISPELYNTIVYNYSMDFNLLYYDGLDDTTDNVRLLYVFKNSVTELLTSLDFEKLLEYQAEFYTGWDRVLNWQQLFKNQQFINDNYDVLAGVFPSQYDEIALVVDKNNEVSDSVLESFGFTEEQIEQGLTVNDFLGKEMRIAHPDAFYSATQSGNTLTISPSMPADYQTLYDNNALGTISVTITAIIRNDVDAVQPRFSTGLVYTPMLIDELIKLNQQSDLMTKIADSTVTKVTYNKLVWNDITNDYALSPTNYRKPTAEEITLSDSTMPDGLSTEEQNVWLGDYNKAIERIEKWQEFERLMGISVNPSSIYIYPKDFNSKTEILNMLDAYNKSVSERDQVLFTDLMSVFMASLGIMIDGISYVLIAFASISLVVSSLMIGIITYVSVVERTREIGVLRSLGARKKDISTLFLAESFMVGATSGLLGVLVAYLFTIPINLILKALVKGISNIAVLNPWHALCLVVISFTLTIIAGIIPSRIAAKKDPVVALRTE